MFTNFIWLRCWSNFFFFFFCFLLGEDSVLYHRWWFGVLAETPLFLRRKGDDAQKALAKLSPAQLESFWKLHDAFQIDNAKTVAGILKTNSIECGDGVIVVCSVGSRFNHSCIPNVAFTWIDTEDQAVFHASPLNDSVKIHLSEICSVNLYIVFFA